MIGLAVDGLAQLGVVYGPVEQVLLVGITDQAAWKEANGARTTLLVSKVTRPRGTASCGLALASQRYH